MSTTLYDLIGVPVEADRKSIDRAYRKLARQLHPDLNPDPQARDRLAAVNDAYATLSNPRRRAAYDTTLEPASLAAPVGEPTVAATSRPETAVRVVLDPTGTRGPDLHVALPLSLRELATGVREQVSAPYYRACPGCAGTGYDTAGPRLRCAPCSGLGMNAVTGATCGECRGTGTVSSSLCRTCGGTKAELATFATEVTAAAGITAGTHRYPGRGIPGAPGQPSGDLVLHVSTNLPACFVHTAAGVGLSVPVHHTELLLGTTITVPGVTRRVEVEIPAGTPDGAVLVAPNGGLPGPDGTPGPLHVRLEAQPVEISDPRVAAALAQLLTAQQSVTDIRAHLNADPGVTTGGLLEGETVAATAS